MKIAVLGAGVSGLTAARLLKDKGYEVTVYEKCEKPGGLAKSRTTKGYLYDPHGGHIFNSKNQNVMDWVFNLLPKDKWQFNVRNAKIFFNGKYVSYPFELSLCELNIDDAVECVHDFILARQGVEPNNFYDWLTWNFGSAIANYYMVPYNEKIWAYPLHKMETQWMQGKMPLPTSKEMIRSMLLKDPSERKMPHSTFYYPIDGGIQSMVDAIANGLDIKLSNPVQKIENINKKWLINGEGNYDNVISTIPLPVLLKLMDDIPGEVKSAIEDLKYNSLTTVLFNCPQTDISWLYIPSHKYRAHRVGYQSSLTHKAAPNKGEGCAALEIIGNKFDVDISCIKNNKIIPEELGMKEVIDSEYTEFAYVIHDMNYRKNTNLILEYFNNVEGFELLGRWAKWNYKNMDLCMNDAFELIEKMEHKK